MLEMGSNSSLYFGTIDTETCGRWRLKRNVSIPPPSDEYPLFHNSIQELDAKWTSRRSLQNVGLETEHFELMDAALRMIEYDPAERITVSEAL